MKRPGFSAEYELAVAGAGIAGIAAAVQAARFGIRTVLIEKSVLPGGLATSGLVNIFLPLCDGRGCQVSFGIAEELFRASFRCGPGGIPEGWNHSGTERLRTSFSPAAFVFALDELLEKAGVDVWYDTLITGVRMRGGRISALEVFNEDGLGLVRAKCFVDASGSCIAARCAGVPCFEGENGASLWALRYDGSLPAGFGQAAGMYFGGAPADGSGFRPPDRLLERLGMTRQEFESKTWRGISGKGVSEFVRFTRRLAREHFNLMRETRGLDRETLFPLALPSMPQFRKICCIRGKSTLKDGMNDTFFEDSVGLAGDWRKAGPVWEIPYGTLVPEQGPSNLLAAGRCASAQGDAWEVTRVIPSASVTGQAAGLAAALSVRSKTDPADLKLSVLQENLRKRGIVLHSKELPEKSAEDMKN